LTYLGRLLAETLAESKLQYLELRNCRFQTMNLAEVMNFLPATMKVLKIEQPPFVRNPSAILGGIYREGHKHQITTLELKDFKGGFTAEGFLLFNNSLPSKILKHVAFDGCNLFWFNPFTRTSLTIILAESLPGSGLVTVNIANNLYLLESTDEARAMGRAITLSSTLRSLDMSSCNIKAYAIKFIASGMKHSSVTSLNLAGNDIGEGVVDIASVIPMSKLTYIDLTKNYVDTCGYRAVT
jgi:Leucine Rich repeat